MLANYDRTASEYDGYIARYKEFINSEYFYYANLYWDLHNKDYIQSRDPLWISANKTLKDRVEANCKWFLWKATEFDTSIYGDYTPFSAGMPVYDKGYKNSINMVKSYTNFLVLKSNYSAVVLTDLTEELNELKSINYKYDDVRAWKFSTQPF